MRQNQHKRHPASQSRLPASKVFDSAPIPCLAPINEAPSAELDWTGLDWTTRRRSAAPHLQAPRKLGSLQLAILVFFFSLIRFLFLLSSTSHLYYFHHIRSFVCFIDDTAGALVRNPTNTGQERQLPVVRPSVARSTSTFKQASNVRPTTHLQQQLPLIRRSFSPASAPPPPPKYRPHS